MTGGLLRIFVRRVELARGDLREHLAHGIAVLPLHHRPAVTEHGNDAHRPDVPDQLPGGDASIGQRHRVVIHVQDASVKNQPGIKLPFDQIVFVHNDLLVWDFRKIL